MSPHDEAKQDMESGLEHAVRVVQARLSQFEQSIFKPSLDSSARFSERRPITTILICIFTMFSVLPVTSFLGFAVLVTAAFFFIGLAGAFTVSIALVISAAVALVITLIPLLLMSVFLTISVVTLFVIIRLGEHLTSESNLKQGFVGWARETRDRLKWQATQESPVAADNKFKRELTAPNSDEWHAVHKERDHM
ncbi:hypothetical protein K439DRAFT_1662118 [Ramaria rubella]|nr:hypothetical protein K439DRAFT_1662118 [Ramaria rubella]